MPLTFQYSLDAGESASFVAPRTPRYVMLWLSESSGRGWQKLSFISSGVELIIKSSNENLASRLQISKEEGSLVLTNNDVVKLGGIFVILAIY